MAGGLGGFENGREEIDGRPMVGSLRYARTYWQRLSAGVAASLPRRLVPPLVTDADLWQTQADASADALADD